MQQKKKRSLAVLCLFALCLSVLAVGLVACNQQKGSETTPGLQKASLKDLPAVAGKAILLTKNETPVTVAITRAEKTYEVALPAQSALFPRDGVRNLHSGDLSLSDLDSQHVIQLKPGAHIMADTNCLTIQEGLVRLRFQKINGEYRIAIPGAALAIRGTTFDVLVRPDQSSAVTLHEGRIAVLHNGTTTEMEEGSVAELTANGQSLNVRVPPAADNKTFHPERK